MAMNYINYRLFVFLWSQNSRYTQSSIFTPGKGEAGQPEFSFFCMKMGFNFTFHAVSLNFIQRAGCCSSNALELSSGSTQFESRPGYSSWLCFMMVFISVCKRMLEQWTGKALLQNPHYSKFIFFFPSHSTLYNLCCWSSVMKYYYYNYYYHHHYTTATATTILLITIIK